MIPRKRCCGHVIHKRWFFHSEDGCFRSRLSLRFGQRSCGQSSWDWSYSQNKQGSRCRSGGLIFRTFPSALLCPFFTLRKKFKRFSTFLWHIRQEVNISLIFRFECWLHIMLILLFIYLHLFFDCLMNAWRTLALWSALWCTGAQANSVSKRICSGG